MDLIGLGFGRTGTLSLKLALERLGFGPCHHMLEMFRHPEQAPTFLAAAEGESVDWPAFFQSYRSAVDWPSVYFWRELLDAFPDARGILTTRDDDSWYSSMLHTIFHALGGPEPTHPVAPGSVLAMNRRIVAQRTFDWRFSDRDHVVSVHHAHVAAVKAALPADRLLVFNVRDGWEPLCRFLGVEAPDEPFPRSNSTEEFLARLPQVEDR